MATSTKAPSVVVTDDSVFGNYAWTNPGNATADDSSYATTDGAGTTTYDNDGNTGGTATIFLVKAGDYSDGFTPTSGGPGVELPTSEASITFGSSTDKWGWTAISASDVRDTNFGCTYAVVSDGGGNGGSALLLCTGFGFSADIGASDTINGVSVTVKRKRVGTTAEVNVITMAVDYTPAGGGGTTVTRGICTMGCGS